jgi:hypothetical protein
MLDKILYEVDSIMIRNKLEVLRWGIVSPHSPNPQAGGPPPVGRPRLLVQYLQLPFISTGRVLHPQPEDAPCCGDRGPT